MRKVSLAICVVALVVALAASAIGQQPRSAFNVVGTETTLADAARANNFPLFEALYSSGAPDAAQFADLHKFWTWSMNDPVGGFYGDELHAKFAREYPDYAAYIADYGIVDANGRAFYPSAETRAFLLKHAIAGEAPRVLVAAKKATPHPKHRAAAAVRHRAPVAAAMPKPAPAVVVPQPQPRPVAVVAIPRPKPEPLPVAPASDDRLARGFAMIIAGLLAAGMLTVMFRTPNETT